MIKILHVVPGLDAGGISNVLLNYYEYLQEEVHFDFVVYGKKVGLNEKKFLKMGSKVFHLPSKGRKYIKFSRVFNNILENEKYDVVHSHENLLGFISLSLAYKKGIKNTVLHSHSCICNPTIRQKLLRGFCMPINNYFAKCKIACGKSAGEWVFGTREVLKNEVFILNNSINPSKFIYSEDVRKEKRIELDIENNFVIGHVGRLCNEKNHEFMLKIADRLREEIKNFKIIFIGNGENQQHIEKLIEEYKLQEYVLMLGRRDDIEVLLNIMDLFILPSHFEAFPVTIVEAAANGLDILCSDNIPEEVCIDQKIVRLPIKEGVDIWCHYIKDYFDKKNNNRTAFKKVDDFDIRKNSIKLYNIYKKLIG